MDGAGVGIGIGRAGTDAVAASLASHDRHHGPAAGSSAAPLWRRVSGGWRGDLLYVECARRQLILYPGAAQTGAKTVT